MTTPESVIKAYVRRIERETIKLSDIKDATTRKDVEAWIAKNGTTA